MLSAVAASWAAGCSDDSPQTRLALREEALLSGRPFEARLSTGTRWAACPEAPPDRLVPVRCEKPPGGTALDSSTGVSTTSAISATDDVRRGAEAAPALLARQGRLLLVAADGIGDLDAAVSVLLRAAEREPEDAALHNDLAAAYFVRAQQTGAVTDLVHALGAAEAAAARVPDDPAVAFNRALVLDRLGVLDAARGAWERYLRFDPASEWGREAQRRHEALRPAARPPRADRTAADDPQAAREVLRDEVLARWAELATTAGTDSPAARVLLDEAVLRASDLAETTGDPLLARVVARLEKASSTTDPDLLRRLAQAHRHYAEASRLQAAGSFADSRPLAEEAVAALDDLGSPLAGWARFLVLRCDFQEQDFAALETVAADILRRVSPALPSALRARTLAVLGSARFGDGRLEAAATAFGAALADFQRLGEEGNQVAVLSNSAPLAEWTGRVEEAWRLRWRTLVRLRRLEDPDRRRLTTMNAALAALDLGEPAAARVLMDEAVALAESSGAPVALTSAYLRRAELRRETGADGGLDDLDRAAAAVDQLDASRQPVNRAQVELERGRWLLATSPWRARRLLEAAVAEQRRRASLLLPRAEIELARALRATDDPRGAEEQLAAALAELERQRRTVSSDFQRIALADAAAEARRELASLHLAQGHPDAALAVLEGGRALRLRERLGERAGMGTGSAAPSAKQVERRLAGLRRALPADAAVVTWFQGDDALAVWVWTSDGTAFVSEPVGRRQLSLLVARTRRAVRAGDGSAERSLAELYWHLLAPVAEHLAGRGSLVLVPEGELFEVPFAALVTPGGRYLVEDFAVALAPGLLALQVAAAPPPPRSLLALSDPAFDAGTHPGRPRLAGAAREGHRVAEIYAAAGAETELLEGEAATARRFLAALGDHDVVHVAAHGVGNAKDPFLSYLLMAPEPGDAESPGGSAGAASRDGLLTGLEILADADADAAANGTASRRPAAPRLVVLAACDSAGSTVTESEGPLGLAWPFLARGSDAVVATLWAVDDAASEELFVAFHRALQDGDGPVTALRRAQVAAVEAGFPMEQWAASEVFASHLEGIEHGWRGLR